MGPFRHLSAAEMESGFAPVERAIQRGPIPGAAAAIGTRDDQRVACFGRVEPGGAEVTPETWYDLASLTKVLCTTPLVLEAIASGRLDPRAPLREILPEIAWLQPSRNLGEASVLQLATHSSGLVAWEPLYTLGLDRPTHLARLLHTPLDGTPGRIVYSDLGFMLLGYILERVYAEPLEAQARALYARIGLESDIAFTPPSDAPVAPTELCPWRGRMLRGEVHDENAAALGGVSGHAGLFATLKGVCGYARALLNGGLHSPAVLEYLATEHAVSDGPDVERRGFGWSLMAPGWSGGDLISRRSIGHTGFTGTGIWIDLERQRYTVLLTNRVHPSRHVDSGIVALRRAFNHVAHGAA